MSSLFSRMAMCINGYHSGRIHFLKHSFAKLFSIQLSQALNDDLFASSSEDTPDHALYRRSSRKVAQMLQQMLQRGEMQVQPHRIHEFLHRLHRRETTG